MRDKVTLAEKFALLDAPFEPGIVGYLNDSKLQIVKVKGPFVWHTHEHTDERAASSTAREQTRRRSSC